MGKRTETISSTKSQINRENSAGDIRGTVRRMQRSKKKLTKKNIQRTNYEIVFEGKYDVFYFF